MGAQFAEEIIIIRRSAVVFVVASCWICVATRCCSQLLGSKVNMGQTQAEGVPSGLLGADKVQDHRRDEAACRGCFYRYSCLT